MPELPDITLYLDALEKRILGRRLERLRITSPFLLRTAAPPLASVESRKVGDLRRLGKRICIRFQDDIWLVLHLMIAGRLHWKELSAPRVSASSEKSTSTRSRSQLAILQFDNGQLSLTEAGTQRRASLHLIQGEDALRSLNPGGVELFQSDLKKGQDRKGLRETFIDLDSFTHVLQSQNHTLKRALTDPRLVSGIGNAYSDEILWQARLSPVKLTQKLTEDEIARLHRATRDTLIEWIDRLRKETGDAFPEKVTAFREGMAVHGRYKERCPRCGAAVQRIRYATNETNYCPTCQTGGRLLADRALSRLLREDWPKTPEELG
jgi:formamidopyrimidine-DNA glycosylase